MEFVMSKKIIAPLAVAIAAIASAADAADVREGIELGAGISRFSFADEEVMEGDFGGKVFAGYRFANPWSVELNYARATPQLDSGDGIKIAQTYASALYHFKTDESYEPYISVGAGQLTFDGMGVSDDSSLVGVGAGIKGYISDRITFRPDFFIASAQELEKPHLLSSITFSYFFGNVSSSAAPSSVKTVAAKKMVDSDKDGVQDGNDACPNTPAGVRVDAKGCALDSDQDGVPDYKDSCANTAMQLKVDAKGCPVKLSESVSIDLKVNFDSNSSVVKPEYFAEIRKVADFMAQYENSVVVIEGHTDTRGAAAYNKSLSQKRADAVAAVLVSEMNVAKRRVTSVGYGEEQPIADESTREGLVANRRVVAKVSASVTKLEQK